MRSILALAAALGPIALPACATSLQRFEFREEHMAAPIQLVFYADSEEAARAAAAAAFAEIATIDALMSDYWSESELSQLNAGAGGPARPVSGRLFSVLKEAKNFAELSGGAFDATVGPVVALWRKARQDGALPSEEELHSALGCVGSNGLHLADDSARLEKAGMKIDLGGIAKGFAADRALALLGRLGIRNAFVACGGDIALGSAPPGESGWSVQAQDGPTLSLSHCGISTSGDSERFVEIGGRRYSHIVDPRTGIGVEHMESVTVIALRATASDALATALSVLGAERGLALTESLPGVSARFLWRDGVEHRSAQSRRFPK